MATATLPREQTLTRKELIEQEQEHQIDLVTALGLDVPDVSRKG